MTLFDDVTQNGTISLSFWGASKNGNAYALGFRAFPHGDPRFTERCFNLCHNRGIIGMTARLHYPYGSKQFAYVAVRSRGRILSGLASQFRSELVMNGEIAPLVDQWNEELGIHDLQYDEEKLDSLSMSRAHRFLDETIVTDNFMARITQDLVGLAPIYEVCGFASIRAGDGGED